MTSDFQMMSAFGSVLKETDLASSITIISYFFYKIYLWCMRVLLHVCKYSTYMQYLKRPEDGARSPGTGVMDS